MSDCPHDLAEQETACADGMCPLCQAAEIERLREENSCLISQRVEAEAEIERLRNELRIRVEWFEKMGHPGMAEATRAVFKKN